MEIQTIKLLGRINKNTYKIDISNKNIVGILDLKSFCCLKELYCQNNQITQIINLPDYLEYIDCSNNQIEKLENLPDCMTGINCKSNPITHLYYPFDVLPKKFPKTLKYLYFGPKFKQKFNLFGNPINIYYSENYYKYGKEIRLNHRINLSKQWGEFFCTPETFEKIVEMTGNKNKLLSRIDFNIYFNYENDIKQQLNGSDYAEHCYHRGHDNVDFCDYIWNIPFVHMLVNDISSEEMEDLKSFYCHEDFKIFEEEIDKLFCKKYSNFKIKTIFRCD